MGLDAYLFLVRDFVDYEDNPAPRDPETGLKIDKIRILLRHWRKRERLNNFILDTFAGESGEQSATLGEKDLETLQRALGRKDLLRRHMAEDVAEEAMQTTATLQLAADILRKDRLAPRPGRFHTVTYIASW